MLKRKGGGGVPPLSIKVMTEDLYFLRLVLNLRYQFNLTIVINIFSFCAL